MTASLTNKHDPHLVYSDIVDIVVRGTNFVLMLWHGGDVEVLLDVVHVVESRHGGDAVVTGQALHLRLQLVLKVESFQIFYSGDQPNGKCKSCLFFVAQLSVNLFIFMNSYLRLL